MIILWNIKIIYCYLNRFYISFDFFDLHFYYISTYNSFMKIQIKHIAANTNPIFHALAYFSQSPNYIAYAFSNQIAIHNTHTLKTLLTLNLNQKQINPGRCNVVRVFQNQKFGYVIGGYENGLIVIYRCEKGNYQNYQKWSIIDSIKQDVSILTLDVLKIKNRALITSLNNKAVVKVYEFFQQLKQIQSISFPLNKIPEAVQTAIVQNNQILLFLGGMDQNIHIYISSIDCIQFKYITSLKGHENAITKISFTKQRQNMLLASSSKDGYVRVWKIVKHSQVPLFQKSVYKLTQTSTIYLQSILFSHEGNVTNLEWGYFKSLSLVTISWDCTVCVTQRDENGTWIVRNRLGQLYGNKNAFFSIIINNQLQYIMTANFTGASCVWAYNKQKNTFETKASFNGHFNQVRAIQWNHSGDFLVSVSKDQTTRVYAQNQSLLSFHEISRAQIHGYDINCLSLVKVKNQVIDLIACGADQKIIRIIQPPSNFANLLNGFTKANLHLYFNSEFEESKYLVKNNEFLQYYTSTQGGTQVLGLMTKAHKVERQKITNYYQKDEQQQQIIQNQENQKVQIVHEFNKPPTQDYLVKHTLWPQMNKLYGHPYQLLTLSSNKDGTLLASSCKSQNKDTSFVIIWDVKTWKIKQRIYFHKNNVNQIIFSEDDQFFITVSKDRTLAVYDRNFKLIYTYEAHLRAVTSVHISHDNRYIITGSRDKSIKIHSIKQRKIISQYKFNNPVFSVRFAPDSYLIGCGNENGNTYLLEFDQKENKIIQIKKIYFYIGHSDVVNKIRWSIKNKQLRLATCSNDFSVRIYSIQP